MKEKILKFYYLNMTSFKCSLLLSKHKRILRTVFSMTFSKISGFILYDEVHFHISGNVNKQNFRFWCNENPRIIHEQPLHAQKVTVRYGIMGAKSIGPYFFEDVDGATVAVKGGNYKQMIQEYLLQ